VLWVARVIHGPVLRTAVRMRWVTAAGFFAVLILSIGYLASNRVKQTFMPEVEGDFVQASIELPQTTPFARMTEVAAQLDAARMALEQETRAETWTDPITHAPSRGVIRSWSQQIEEQRIQAWIVLTPPEFREMRSRRIQERLKELLGPVPDAERINFAISGNDTDPNIQIAVLGENPDDLRAAVDELKARLSQFSAVSSVRDSQEAAAEELRFTLLPGAEQMGVTLAQVSRQVRQA
jgi:multidrug efflux pump subunit AcrB